MKNKYFPACKGGKAEGQLGIKCVKPGLKCGKVAAIDSTVGCIAAAKPVAYGLRLLPYQLRCKPDMGVGASVLPGVLISIFRGPERYALPGIYNGGVF